MSEEKPRRYTDRVLEWVSRRSAFLFALVVVAGLIGTVLLARLIVQASAGAPAARVTPAPAQPTLSAEPTEARSGDEVTVVGLGWRPGETVLIRLEDAQAGSNVQAYVASAVVTESGSFLITFRVPANEPWASLACIRVEAFAPERGIEAAAEVRIVDELAPTPLPTDTPAPTASPEVTASPTPIPDVESWRGEYFSSPDLAGQPALVRYDREINFYWDHGAPDAALPADSFSVRWQRTLSMEAGTYRFFVRVDDGVRVWVDEELIIDQWKLNPAVTYSAEHAIEAGLHTIQVEYFEDHEAALIQLWWVREGEFPQWRGAYYNNTDLIGAPALVRNDAAIDFNWGRGGPADAVGVDGFAVRWTREMPFEAGVYRFRAVVDDGMRLFVDNVLVIDAWDVGSAREVTGERNLSAGNHFLRVEYFEEAGEARISLGWEKASEAVFPDWRGEYWTNPALNGDPAIVRNDEVIDFNWGHESPDSALPANGFSARWTRTVNFDDAIYRFNALVDDGVRVWLDGRLIIDAWREGSARHVRQEVTVAPGPHAIRVEYYEGRGDAQIRVWWEKVSAASYPDWRGAYWGNRSLSGDPVVVQNDETVTFNWGTGAPHASLPSDDFSARWTRTASFDAAMYRFHVHVDDGARLWLDDQLVINAWEDGAAREITADVLVARGEHAVKVEYYEHAGQASIRVWWEKAPNPAFTEWKGEYFANNDLSGAPALVRNDAEVKFSWGLAAPAQGLPADDFSVRWTRWV
ncbi:MAG: hypothetical protein GX601_02435, partial [Anaerolineales bacterium]|nr:hypothetical protein [Anaerolineales bacterium]